MMTLSQEEKGLPQKISDDIVALILEENLKPGDKLPNETILSQRLDVGRSSLREAMKLLWPPETLSPSARDPEPISPRLLVW